MSFVSVIGWFSCAEQHHAVPTTQGPAGRAGQGGSLSPGPRFNDSTNACFANEIEWNLPLRKKLAVDFSPGTRLRASMDDDTSDLISVLCTQAGMTMEDASIVALTVTGMQRAERLAALAELEAAAVRITVLIRAAKVLMS